MSKTVRQKPKYNPFKVDDKDSPFAEKLKKFLSYTPSIPNLDDVRKDLEKKQQEWEEQHPKEEGRYYRSNASPSLDVAVHGLEKMGFVKIQENQTVRFRHYRNDDQPDVFQIWAHPVGILVEVDTSGKDRGAWRVNSIYARMSVDVGRGFNLSYPLSRSGTYSSSGYSYIAGGKSSHDVSFSSDNIFSFLDFVKSHVQTGVILPFDQWPDGVFAGTLNANQFLQSSDFENFPLSSQERREEITQQLISQVDAFKQTPSVTSIPGLSETIHEMLLGALRYSSEEDFSKSQNADLYLAQQPDRIKNRLPRSADLFVEYVDKMTAYHLERYPPQAELDVVNACVEGFKGNAVLSLQEMSAVSPFGSSWLLGCLSGCAQGSYRVLDNDESCLEMLKHAIENISFSSLRQQVEEPDITGMSFFTHMANHMFASWHTATPGSRYVYTHAEQIVSWVADRYKKEGVCLPDVGNEQHTLRGVWFRNYVSYKDHQKAVQPPFSMVSDFENLLDRVGFGVNRSWNLIFPCTVDDTRSGLKYKVSRSVVAATTSDFVNQLPEEVIDDPVLFKELLTHHLADFISEKSPSVSRKM